MEEVSNVILGIAGKADRFKLKFGWFTFHLRIKPLSAKQIIEISDQLSCLRDVSDGDGTMFQAEMKCASGLRHIAKAIAIATDTRCRFFVTRAILNLPLAHIETLKDIVKKQCDVHRFFFIWMDLKEMNPIKKKQEER